MHREIHECTWKSTIGSWDRGAKEISSVIDLSMYFNAMNVYTRSYDIQTCIRECTMCILSHGEGVGMREKVSKKRAIGIKRRKVCIRRCHQRSRRRSRWDSFGWFSTPT